MQAVFVGGCGSFGFLLVSDFVVVVVVFVVVVALGTTSSPCSGSLLQT